MRSEISFSLIRCTFFAFLIGLCLQVYPSEIKKPVTFHVEIVMIVDYYVSLPDVVAASEVIKRRLLNFGIHEQDIEIAVQMDSIKIDIAHVDFPDYIIQLISAPGYLEFWETMDYQDIYSYLDLADERMRSYRLLTSSTGHVSLQENEMPDTNNLRALQPEEQYAIEHPLFSLLKPAIIEDSDGNYYLSRGPVVGYSLLSDTAKVMTILKFPEIRKLFPRNVYFAWHHISLQNDKNETLELIALNSTTNGITSLQGDVIVQAKAEKNKIGIMEVNMTMNAKGTRIWKEVTATNIGKHIAIVLDHNVLACPLVCAEITSGKSSITGFLEIDAQFVASILMSGALPASRIVNVMVREEH